ncbi:CU044_5270 family protein [Streptomyces sp. NPDC086080]|uniref:CU044_5270 family protein n=1 Tax=Streptomyces sp. NPDC086080 TaxID=3365748 RepID=UPI0037CCF98C
MNASAFQPPPAEWTETQDLLPSVARDLPAGRHQFHKEQMMARIHEDLRTTNLTPSAGRDASGAGRRNPFLRRVVLLPALAFTLAGAVVTGAVLVDGGKDGGAATLATGPALTTEIGTVDAKGAPQLLDRISLAAADAEEPGPREGQYVYIASKVADAYIKIVGDKATVASKKLHPRQVWNSLDGRDGWLIEPGETGKEGMTLASEVPFSAAYDTLAKLPTDPDALLERIYRESDADRDPEVPRDQAAFAAIGDLLTESHPPAEVAAALYKAAAKIPGVVKVDDAVDAIGRHGVAIARQDDTGERAEWIFDKKTLAFLGERNVIVEKSADSPFTVGTVTHSSAITQRAFVDNRKQLPGQAG